MAPAAAATAAGSSSRRKVKLTFHNSTRSEDLNDFAVLVALDSTRIDYAACPGGANLRFTDPDGTQLAYEIESWDAAAKSFVWVRVPKIDHASDADFIYMHYGDATLSDAQMPSQVWANADGVWHLSQDPGGHGLGDIKDSTGSRDGTASFAMSSGDLVDAMVGKGYRLNGTGGGVDALSALEASYTWSAWLKGDAAPTTANGNHEPVCNGDTTFNFAWDHGNAAFAGAAAHRDVTAWRTAQASGLVANTWYHLTGTFNGTQLCLYVDAGSPICTNAGLPELPSGAFQIGDATSNGSTFAGYADEVRVYSVSHTATWINADHASQTDTLITYGSPVPE